jgi:hypothetical protein
MNKEDQEKDYALQQKVFCDIVEKASSTAKVTFDSRVVGKVYIEVRSAEEQEKIANALKTQWPFEASFRVSCAIVEGSSKPIENEQEVFEDSSPKKSRMEKLEDALRSGANRDTFKAASECTQKFAELVGSFIVSATMQPSAKALITFAKIENGALRQSYIEVDFDTLSTFSTHVKADVENDDDAVTNAKNAIKNVDSVAPVKEDEHSDDSLMQDS